jgi:hypothetical protein
MFRLLTPPLNEGPENAVGTSDEKERQNASMNDWGEQPITTATG